MALDRRDDPLRSALFTDLYELTMAQAYDAEGMTETAVFELFFRTLPPHRNYVVAAGLDDVLAYLENLSVTDEDLAYLREQQKFSEGFLDRLKRLRFTGDVDAVPEGTVVFGGEPMIRVVAPLWEAQLVETLLINQVHMQSLVATKAARLVSAAGGRTVVDFGSRRAHGADAALKVARASYLAGVAGTSLVLAGKRYGVPIFGTMAHSYIQTHGDEAAAFEAFGRLYPQTTLLVDTYDTLAGVRKVIEVHRKTGGAVLPQAIRLDSGDLAALSVDCRKLLDEAGLAEVRIFASSELDEYEIARLIDTGAPIDGFGVGTRLAVVEDGPSMDVVYKLVEYANRPRMKLSTKKVLYPGRKQVFRQFDSGRATHDVLARGDERLPGEPLLHPVMRGGQRLPAGRATTLQEARERARRQLAQLPERLLGLERVDEPYRVDVSDALERQFQTLRETLERR